MSCKLPVENTQAVGDIGNYYGGLEVGTLDGKYYWGISNWSGTFWEEIPESLYNELVRFGREE